MKQNKYKPNPNECFEQYMRVCKRCNKLYYTPAQNSVICQECSKSNKDPWKKEKNG